MNPEDPPEIEEAVESREEMLEDIADRRGLTREELLERLEELDLREEHTNIRPTTDTMNPEEPTLEDALDGLTAATNYAEEIGEPELAERIAAIYQELGDVAPEDEWNVDLSGSADEFKAAVEEVEEQLSGDVE